MGAGVIFASGGRVHGLTTAAALWSSMAIGLCAGLGGYGIAAALVVVTLLFLTPVDVLSARLVAHYGWEERTFQLVANDIPAVRRAEEALVDRGAQTRQMELQTLADGIGARLLVRCRGRDIADIHTRLAAVQGVSFVSNAALYRGEG
jgi:putative Mg2+ transporter-C (MgtC) family protein